MLTEGLNLSLGVDFKSAVWFTFIDVLSKEIIQLLLLLLSLLYE